MRSAQFTTRSSVIERIAPDGSTFSLRLHPRGFAPRTPLHTLSRAASPARSVFIRGASPLGLPYTLSRAPLRRRAPFAWLARGARSLAHLRALYVTSTSLLRPCGGRR